MITFKNDSTLIYLIIFTLFLTNTSCKGGRGGGGGGGGRGGLGGARFGSNTNTRLGSNSANNVRTGYGSGNVGGGGAGVGYGGGGYVGNTYRGAGGAGGSLYSSVRTGGVRWASFGAGLLAYNAMSSLARSGQYNSYYHRNSYHQTNSRYNGEECVNNEDFNGTLFGRFRCPLPLPEPDFDPSAKYCCGTNQTQYCCRYLDDNSRRVSTFSAVFCVVAIFICSAALISRMLKRRGSFKMNQNQYSSPPNQNYNMTNINRNMNNGPRPFFKPMQQRPNMNMRPGPGPGPNIRDGTNHPFIPNPPMNNLQNSAPYPMQHMMPQPNNAMMPTPMSMPEPPKMDYDGNLPPPSYTEVVLKNNLNNIVPADAPSPTPQTNNEIKS